MSFSMALCFIYEVGWNNYFHDLSATRTSFLLFNAFQRLGFCNDAGDNASIDLQGLVSCKFQLALVP